MNTLSVDTVLRSVASYLVMLHSQLLDVCQLRLLQQIVEGTRRVEYGDMSNLTVRFEKVELDAQLTLELSLDCSSKDARSLNLNDRGEEPPFYNENGDECALAPVKAAVETRRNCRRRRRQRKTPCRQNRRNRVHGGLPPSTKARWGLKLRILDQLSKVYPITDVVVEDIKAAPKKGKRRWNVNFSPLEVGKAWFYTEVATRASLTLRQGWWTAKERERLGLAKTPKKMAEVFEAHCVDSWCLARDVVGGHRKPGNTRLLCVVPLRFHRRQLHVMVSAKGGTRKKYGSTRSHGMRRGSLVKHPKYGVAYLGGCQGTRISLHRLSDGKRVTETAHTADAKHLNYNAFRTYTK